MAAEIDVTLLLGRNSPTRAPAGVMRALTSVDVTSGDSAPAVFRLGFDADMADDDLALIAEHFADPFARVVVQVSLSGLASVSAVLIDGYVTALDFEPETAARAARLEISGADAAAKMDLVELSTEYPSMSDAAIVGQILARYAALATASVTAPETDPVPTSFVPQQNATDLAQLRLLARRHAAVFHIVPQGSGKPVAYWGPPPSGTVAPHALTVGAGAACNVRALRFRRDALAPTVTYGAVLDTAVAPPVRRKVAVSSASAGLGYASNPALSDGAALANDPVALGGSVAALRLRGSLFYHQGLDPSGAAMVAQARTDRSVQQAVTASGTLDTFEYGGVLLAPGTVAVRGAGDSFDGKYRVSQVSHRIVFRAGSDSYSQEFTLCRDGTGSTVNRVTP